MRPRRALQVSYWKVAALMAFGAFPSGPLQLSRRNATFFIKYWGGGCSCIRVLGEQFPPARGVSDSPIYSFGRTIPPDMGGKRFPKFEVLMKQSIPAAKTPILQPLQAEDARTCNCRLPATARASGSPLGVHKLRCPFVRWLLRRSACKGPVSLGWSLLTLGARTPFLGLGLDFDAFWSAFFGPPPNPRF